MILTMPLPTVIKLQMPMSKKFKYLAVLGCGLFACITSVMRLFYAVEIQKVPRGHAGHQASFDKEGVWA